MLMLSANDRRQTGHVTNVYVTANQMARSQRRVSLKHVSVFSMQVTVEELLYFQNIVCVCVIVLCFLFY